MRTAAEPAQLDRMFFALADEYRRSIIDRLSRGPASVSDLAGSLGIALPSAIKHLAVLEQGGLVASNKVGACAPTGWSPRRSARWKPGLQGERGLPGQSR